MLRLITDHNFDGRILRGLQRRIPHLDVVHAFAVGLAMADDPALLAWAAAQDRVVLTHDANTLVGFAS